MQNLFKADQRAAHKKLDSIYSEIFSKIDNESLTFQELSEEVFRRKNELAGLILKGALNYELRKQEEPRKACPRCNRIVTRHRQKTGTLQSVNGHFLFTRGYFYCRSCKHGFCPADRELQIIPRELQFDIQWRALELAVRLPFEEAARDLKHHYGAKFDKRLMHKLVREVAENSTVRTAAKKTCETKKMLSDLRNRNKRRTIVVIGVDGAYVPLRPDHKDRKGKRGKGYWREAKGIRVYAIADKRIHHILSWHQIQNADELKRCLDSILEMGIVPQDMARVCVCADGAEWIWNRVVKVFPDAKMVLDYYHCAEHLHRFANAYFGDDDERRLGWLKDAKAHLFSGEVLRLVGKLRGMNSADDEISNEILALANYLEERADMTYYKSFGKGGYPIGSGGIESSNKYICHRRMKLSGAWWKEEMANDMLALRSAYANGTLYHVFGLYKEKTIKKIL